jgi:hypothetical protein
VIASWVHAGSYFNHSPRTQLATSHPECYIFSSPNLLCLKCYLTVSSVDCYSVSPDTWHLVNHPVLCSLIVTVGIVCVVLLACLRLKCFLTVGCWSVRFLSVTDGPMWLLKFKMKWLQIKFHKYLLLIKLGIPCVPMCYTKAYTWKLAQIRSCSCLKARNLVFCLI